MLISFTGAQSSGKSTLLAKMMEDPDFKDWSFEPEITRKLKERYNLNINESGDNFTQMVTINSHVDNYLRNKDKNCVLDRCCIDGLVYTTYLEIKNKADGALTDYAEYVCKKLIDKYTIIFYTDPSIPLVNDGVRSVDTQFRDDIIKIFNLYFEYAKPTNIVTLSGSVDERYNTIKQKIYEQSNPR